MLQIIPFMENKLIITIFSENNGIVKGVCYKRSKKFNIASIVKFEWRARLITQLGTIEAEEETSLLPYYMNDNTLLLIFDILNMSLINGIEEKVEYKALYEKTYDLVLDLVKVKDRKEKIAKYILFEIYFLGQIGYGLSLDRCVVTKTNNLKDLYYISPKTGNAVVKSEGERYHNRLFIYYDFIKYNDTNMATCMEQIKKSFNMTGFFINNALGFGEKYGKLRSNVISD